MNTVFDPTILFLSNAEWQNMFKRDVFLEHLSRHLEYIDEYKITKIYWTHELEEVLWNDPHLPPWRIDRDWNINIVPIIYRRFSMHRIFIEIPDGILLCNMEPPFICRCCKLEAHEYFMELMGLILRNKELVYLCVGAENQLSGNKKFSFVSDCHSFELTPILINNPNDWFRHINITDDFWPSLYSEEEIERFKIALHIIAKVKFSKDIEDDFLYGFEFEKAFIEKISRELKYRKNIMSGIVKRLLINQGAASADGGLKDEIVKSKENERRFRVTGGSRIHYRYEKSNKIVFTNYYGEGEHDSGL